MTLLLHKEVKLSVNSLVVVVFMVDLDALLFVLSRLNKIEIPNEGNVHICSNVFPSPAA